MEKKRKEGKRGKKNKGNKNQNKNGREESVGRNEGKEKAEKIEVSKRM